MIKREVYKRPDMTVMQMEEGCVMLAGSDHNNKGLTLDGSEFPDVKPNPPKEENPDEIDAKKNNSWGWNDSWNE